MVKVAAWPKKNDFIVIDRRFYHLSAAVTYKFHSLTHLRLFKLHIIDSFGYRLLFYRFKCFNLKLFGIFGQFKTQFVELVSQVAS